MKSAPVIQPHSAFTLIELLIVVAILAVLSAIATPNFLEAHTRAKVSRTQSDLKALTTALEAYRIDYTGYPVVGNPDYPTPFDLHYPLDRRLRPLTTPISYMSTLPPDPFYSRDAKGIEAAHNLYYYSPGNLYTGGTSKEFVKSAYRNTIFSIGGRGPDKNVEVIGYCMAHPWAHANKYNITGRYDPTNGTVSVGDIFKTGSGTLGQSR